MKAHQIFLEMKDETASGVFQYLRNEERPVYAAALTSLATNRKLRPVFVQKKTVPQQIDWLVKNIRLKGANEVAENVLQIWLLKGNKDMLIAFLNGLEIEHDGEGAAEDIPEEIDGKKLKQTVDKLIADYDAERVKIYLHMFQMQKAEGWPEITDLIAENPDLQYESQAAGKSEPASSEA
jgi:hypothetical protein